MIFEPPHLGAEEQEVLERIDGMRSSLRVEVAAGRPWSGLLRQVLFARALRGSNSIEGYLVSESDAMAAVEGAEPLATDPDTYATVRGYSDAMTYVLQMSEQDYFEYSLILWTSLHFMMLKHDFKKHPGRFRRGAIFVRDAQTHDILYEGPLARDVPALVSELVQALNTDTSTPPIIRAGMAHLNLTMIHPFSDGNGRMARILESLVLTRSGILQAPFCSIEEWLGMNTPAYYAVLSEVGKGSWQPHRDARPWARFILRAHWEQTHTIARRVKEAQRLYEQLETATQRLGLPDRVIVPLYNASLGFAIRRSTYCMATDVSEWQASRDLRRLSDVGLLLPEGEKRGRFYTASDELREYHLKTREPRLPVADPFAE